MSEQFDVLVDSDAFVGYYLPKDAHHETASDIFDRMRAREQSLVTTSWVLAETATVLSHHSSQEAAKRFLEEIEQGQFPVIHITEDLQQEATRIFKEQTTKGTSMTDCGNVAVIQRFAIPVIFSFDQVYPKHFHLKPAA